METIYDTPWWMLALIAAVGAWLLVMGNRQMDRTLRWVGAGAILLALALGVTSYYLESDVEIVERRSVELVEAVEAGDWVAARALMDPAVSFFHYRNRDQLLAGAQSAADRAGIRSASVSSLTTEKIDPYITTNFTVFSRQDATGDYPYRSYWQLEWVETDQGWVVVSITPIAGPGSDPGIIENRLP